MAMENKRIIQLSTERTTLGDDDYTIVDSENNGTAKYRLSKLKETDTTLSVSGMAADAAATGQAIDDEATARDNAVTAEAEARAAAVTAEASARQSADTTLQGNITAEAQARAAADTALGDEVSDLKSALTGVENEIYSYSQKSVTSSSDGWRLNESDGLCSSNSGYQLAKYAVTAGDMVKVVSDDRFQFQTVVSVPSSGANNRVGATYGTGSFILTVPETATYLIVSTPTTSSAAVYNVGSNVSEISQSIQNVDYNIAEIKDTYDTKKTIITSNETTGSYINTDGSVATSSGMSYKQATVDSSLVGKEIKVTGTGWYSIVPYVFVPTSGAPIYPSVNPGSTVTQYTDLLFIPQTTGTLYVNRYISNPPQIAEAYYYEIANVKSEYIASIDNVKDAVSYKVVALEMTSGKLLNGNTGAITDITSDAYRVSQYVEVNEDTDYLITTENFWSNGLYAWYDSNKNYIAGASSQSGGTATKIYCQKVRSPKNAAYLVIGFLYQPNFQFPFLMEGENKSIMPSKRWSGKKWTCVGDSLTEAYSVTGAHYFDLISAATGIETVNKGVSGTGYARGTDNFMTRALTVPTDSDVVTFFGSGNDSGAGLPLGTASDTGTDTLGGCINTAIDNLYSIMPVVQLGIVTPTPWHGNMPSDNGWMANYSALIVDICKRRSIPCLDLFHCSNLNPNSAEVRQIAYARDGGGGVHPSEVGHAIIAPRFLAFLESLLMH